MGTSEGARKGWTEESRKKRAEAMRRKWEDPEYRARRAAGEKDPGTKANRSAGAIKANADPEKRRKHSELMKEKFASDEEFQAKHSEGLRESWQNPEIAASHAAGNRRAWQENPQAFISSLKAIVDAARSPEGRARQRKAMAQVAARNPVTIREMMVAHILNELKIPYQIHAIREDREMDILTEDNLNIEVDGNNHLGAYLKAKDAERDKFLQSKGYRVLRISHAAIDDGSFITGLQEALK